MEERSADVHPQSQRTRAPAALTVAQDERDEVMAGVSSYAPPAGVISDLAQTDARDVMGRMIAYRTQKAGFAGARRQAMERMEELVDTCTWYARLTHSHGNAPAKLCTVFRASESS